MPRRKLAPRFPMVVRSLLHGDAAPDPSAGPLPPVILLHGFGTSSAVTAPLARSLRRELGRPVIRVPLGGRLPIHLGDVRKSAARVLGFFSRAIWQMIPGSPLLCELARLPVPNGSEVVAVASDADNLVPGPFARPRGMPRLRCAGVSGLGHVEFLTSPLAFRLVQAVLAV